MRNKFYRLIMLASKRALKLFLFHFIALQFIWASSSGQKLSDYSIDLQVDNTSLSEIFEEISEKTDIRFAYNKKKLGNSRYSFKVENLPLDQLLQQIANENKINFRYMNGTISVQAAKYSDIDEDYGTSVSIVPEKEGTVTGRVLDEETGEPLVGATVRLEGTLLGVTTDIDGQFRIDNVPVGNYNLIISFIGFATKRVPNIAVQEGEILSVQVMMNPSTSHLDEVVVLGDIDVKQAPIEHTTEVKMVSSIKDSELILTGISAKQISMSLDRDAGDVAKRVTGVSVLNDFVQVRGLDKRYVNTQINNLTTPSAEMDTRAFRFNLMPSGAIDRIMVYKTPAPELPAYFGAGVIKVYTKEAVTARRVEIGVSSQYRSGSTFQDHIYYNETSSKDWYGGGVGDRQLPSELIDPDYDYPGMSDRLYRTETAEIADRLPAIRTPKQHTLTPDMRGNLNYYDSWKLWGIRLNNRTSLSYTTQSRATVRETQFEPGPFSLNEETGAFEPGPFIGSNIDSVFSKSVRMTAMENLSLKLNDYHKVGFNIFNNRSTSDDMLVRNGIEEYDQQFKTYSSKYERNDLKQYQLLGSHSFGNHDLVPGGALRHDLDWTVGFNKVRSDMPHIQTFDYGIANGNQDSVTLWIPDWSRQLEALQLSFITEDKGQVGQLNYVGTTPDGIKIKTGVYIESRERNALAFQYKTQRANNGNVLSNQNLAAVAPWTTLADTLYDHYYLVDGTGLLLDKVYHEDGSYGFTDEFRAGYLGLGIPLLSNRFYLYGGVRYEWNERILYDAEGHSIDSVQVGLLDGGVLVYDPIPEPVKDYLLPSVTLTWNVTGRMKTRLSYGRTLDRPEYREQSNFYFYDNFNDRSEQGNPFLKFSTLDHYDLRWEYYPSASEFISFGVFYKYIQDGIEPYTFVPSGAERPQVQYHNTDEITAYGLEIEVRKNMAFVNPTLETLSLLMNASLLKSKVERPNTVHHKYPDRPFVGGAPYLINAGLYYESRSEKTTASVLYNLTGPRMLMAPDNGGKVNFGLWEMERHLVDVTFTHQLTRHLSVKAGVQNLLDAPIRIFRDISQNNKYDPDNVIDIGIDGDAYYADIMQSRYKEGSYYSLGIKLSL